MATSSLCIPIATGKKKKSDWKQWSVPIKVFHEVCESLREECRDEDDQEERLYESNPLDRKPPHNQMAGSRAKVFSKNSMVVPAKRNLGGFRSGSFSGRAARAQNPLAFPTNRLGLAFRAVADGVNLTESIRSAILDK